VSSVRSSAPKNKKTCGAANSCFSDEADPAQLRPGLNTVVAVDNLGAGSGDIVLFCQGSSARQGSGLKTLPVDAAVVGLVDTIEVLGHNVPLPPPPK